MGRRSARRSNAQPATEDFEPDIRPGIELPPEVLEAREAAKRLYERMEHVLQPRIDGHLVAYRIVLDDLLEAHRYIGDTMDFGLGARTRWTAVWEMSGRCLGLCNAALSLLSDGFASETVPTFRSIHEAGQLLTVLAGPGEERLLRRWLDDTYIGAAQARAAEARINRPTVQALKKQGTELKGDQQDLGSQVYNIMSKPAHNMRIGFAESRSVPTRRFSYGRHPDAGHRAVHVEYGGQLLEEVTLRIGSAFASRFLGRYFYAETIKRLLLSIRAVRDEMPIDPRTVNRLRQELTE